MCVGLLVEEEEVSVSKIFKREKGCRSFVRLSLTAMQFETVVRLLVFCLADVGEPGEMSSHFVAKALWRLVPEVF